jgi:hypothetical protein
VPWIALVGNGGQHAGQRPHERHLDRVGNWNTCVLDLGAREICTSFHEANLITDGWATKMRADGSALTRRAFLAQATAGLANTSKRLIIDTYLEIWTIDPKFPSIIRSTRTPSPT